MGEIIRPNFITVADLPVDDVLNKSLACKFEQVIVLGFDADGDLQAFGSSADLGTALLMFEKFKMKFI